MKQVLGIMIAFITLLSGVEKATALEKSAVLSGGKIVNGVDQVLIAKDNIFSELTNRFEALDTIYFRVNSERVRRLKGVNYIYLLDKTGNKTDQEVRLVQAGIGEFVAEMNLESLEDGLYFVEIKINGLGERNRPEELMLTQEITIGQTSDLFEWFLVTKPEVSSVGVGVNRELGMSLNLGNGVLDRQTFMVYDLNGNRQKVSVFENLSEGGVFKFKLSLHDLELEADQWYWLSYDLSVEKGDRYRGAKAFLVKDSLPEAVISAPLNKEQVSGLVEIMGTASDDLFYKYALQVTDKDGLMTEIGQEQLEAVVEDVLGNWSTDTFEKDKYLIGLKAVDLVGNKSQNQVEVYLRGHTKKFKLQVPKKVVFDEIEVATYEQVNRGSIGENDGKNGIEVEDDRGAYTGWSVTGSMTDFEFEDQVIKLTNLQISPQQVLVDKGQSDGVWAGASIRPEVEELFSLMQADVGYGNGKYRQQVLLDLSIPANSVAGDYQSRLTITLQ